MERVWGGRRLQELYGKSLPPEEPIGESWEVVDREAVSSVVQSGPFKGRTLGQLWREHREEVFGQNAPEGERFPLLIKILDARERLSLQVHPPADLAPALGGEPKTEVWVVASAAEGARLWAGVRAGVTRESFAAALEEGRAEELVHSLPVQSGDVMFVPSGRLHAIGAGNVIFEIQQNSDTTYRVFDWNRPGTDGRPRELHVRESLQCIDFADVEPGLQIAEGELLVECPYFRLERWSLTEPREAVQPGRFCLIGVLRGNVRCGSGHFGAGEFALIPAGLEDRTLHPVSDDVDLLRITPGGEHG